MIQHSLKKLPKHTYEIDVTIPWAEIQVAYDKAFDTLHQGLSIEGYRKGKAPKQMAEKQIKQEAVYQQLIRDILPRIYDDIVKKEALKPVMSPKIDLKSAKENEDWQVVMSVAEKPEIDLGDYKKTVQEAKAEGKKDELWVPGKDEKKSENPDAENQKKLNEVLAAILKNSKCEISDLILEEELEGRLARLVDDIQKLGLTVDSYLKSKNLTMDDLRAQYKKEIEDTYKLEFILAEIAEKENITVDNAELEALFTHIKDEKERQAAQSNAYFYASILRKQKVLDFLISL